MALKTRRDLFCLRAGIKIEYIHQTSRLRFKELADVNALNRLIWLSKDVKKSGLHKRGISGKKGRPLATTTI